MVSIRFSSFGVVFGAVGFVIALVFFFCCERIVEILKNKTNKMNMFFISDTIVFFKICLS